MIGIPIGLLTANATEWVVHKYVLHGLGKKKESFWAFHWHEHHRATRRNAHLDDDYAKPIWQSSSKLKEAAALGLGAVSVLPLFPVAPFFTATLWYSAVNYYYKHRKSHLDAEWARTHLSWHYDHHMGPDQNMNWCVTRPWFDQILKTRRPYVGTEREAADLARKAAKQARKAA